MNAATTSRDWNPGRDTRAGLSQAALSQAGLSQARLSQAGLSQAGLSQAAQPSRPGALDGLALAIGTALVAWGERRRERRATPPDRETVMLRIAAQREVQLIEARRELGASQLLR